MKFLKGIYRVWALILATISFLVVFPVYVFIFHFFPKKKRVGAAHKISRIWAQSLFFSMFANVRILKRELLDPDAIYVFVANHRSFLDVPLFAISNDHNFRFLAKHELTKIPVMGYVIRHIYITVSRNSIADRQKSISKLKESLEEGISVFICPEGTRNNTAETLLSFKDGAFAVAIEQQVPIAVLTILNSDRLMPPGNFMSFIPGTIDAIWSKPLQTKGLTDADVPQLKEQVRRIMLGNLGVQIPEEDNSDHQASVRIS